jgi:hypothetical protein
VGFISLNGVQTRAESVARSETPLAPQTHSSVWHNSNTATPIFPVIEFRKVRGGVILSIETQSTLWAHGR